MRQTKDGGWEQKAGRALTLVAAVGALSACDDLLEVDLPHILTDAAIEGAASAPVQVNSAIALFECGYTHFGLMGLGAEDVAQSIAGVYSGGHVYDHTPDTGTCDGSDTNDSWFDQIMGARAMLSSDPALMTPTGASVTAVGEANGVYDKIVSGEFALGAPGERLAAIGALYTAMSITHLGEFVCDIGLDGSELYTPLQALDVADAWVGRALTHIGNYGDFAMPFGVAASAQNMATAVRARLLWASQDLAGANTAAGAVLAADPEFVAWVTREAGDTRRNKIWFNVSSVGFSGMLGINDWWNPANYGPNPATGTPWPSPIPFTGYLFLGIYPDGRALEAGNQPVRWAEEFRQLGEDPTPLANGAVEDTRVLHFKKTIQGPAPEEVPATYSGDDSDIPYMTWQELKLIQADYQLHEVGGAAGHAAAIGLVNEIRTAAGLPTITGAYLTTLTDGTNDAAEVRAMLLEERRRELFNEGARYWSTKIQNTDMLWFPRYQGQTPFQGYNLLGAVRQLFASDEYESNLNWVAAGAQNARGTGCGPSVMGSLGGNPGDQRPVF